MIRYDVWSTIYGELVQAGGDRNGFEYTDAAYAIFPRYNLIQAVLDRVEALDPDALPPLEDLRLSLVQATEAAAPDSTGPMANAITLRAIAEERETLAQTIRKVGSTELAEVDPLPYRRTLHPEEVRSWRLVIETMWGARNDYWYPLGEKTHPSLVALELYGIDHSELQDRIKRFLADNGVARVIELRENGASYELDADAVEVVYNLAAEGFWTTAGSEWIAYCSHEDTITLGGKIAAEVAPAYPASHFDPSQPPHWMARRQ
jgi:hypothetical protein